MSSDTDDIVPINRVRASFTQLAKDVRSGKEKIITRDGESYVALIDARRLAHYHMLEREHIHLALLDEAIKGLADVEAGRTSVGTAVRTGYRIGAKRNK